MEEKRKLNKKTVIIIVGILVIIGAIGLSGSKPISKSENIIPTQEARQAEDQKVMDSAKKQIDEAKKSLEESASSSTNPNVTSITKPADINSPVSQTNNTDIFKILKENAKQKWGTDYEMVQYTYNNQVEAYNWVMAQTEYPEIMAKAKIKWGNDFEMVKYTYQNQVEAYKWVNAQTEYPDIMISAKSKWEDDYEMVKYEYENQVEAYKNL